MSEVRYKFNNKYNKDYKKVTKAVCNYCLEQTTFRVVMIDGVNRLACTRCLKSCRFNKKYKPIQHPIIKVTYFTKKEYVYRFLYRIRRWFKGDHIYKPFGRKRTK